MDDVVLDDVPTYLDINGSSWVLEDPRNKEFDMTCSDVVGEHEFTCRDSMKSSDSSNVPDKGMGYNNVTVEAQVGRLQVDKLQVHEQG